MKLTLINTPMGLVPCYDADHDEKKKLTIGAMYTAEIKQVRNLQFHRKYMALVSVAWEYLTEKQMRMFGTIDSFRRTIQVAAGYFDTYYSVERKEWLQMPRSIAFDRMDEAEFSDLYDRVKDVLVELVFKDMPTKELDAILTTF